RSARAEVKQRSSAVTAMPFCCEESSDRGAEVCPGGDRFEGGGGAEDGGVVVPAADDLETDRQAVVVEAAGGGGGGVGGRGVGVGDGGPVGGGGHGLAAELGRAVVAGGEGGATEGGGEEEIVALHKGTHGLVVGVAADLEGSDFGAGQATAVLDDWDPAGVDLVADAIEVLEVEGGGARGPEVGPDLVGIIETGIDYFDVAAEFCEAADGAGGAVEDGGFDGGVAEIRRPGDAETGDVALTRGEVIDVARPGEAVAGVGTG